MAKRLTYQDIRDLDAAEVGKMSTEDLRSLLEQVRNKLDVRGKSFTRQREKIYSPAYNAILKYYVDAGMPPVENVSRNRAYNEIFQIRQFFRSKTSDVKEARRFNIEQDKMLFGTTKSGRAKFRMDSEMRTRFWDLYDDFTGTSKLAETVYGYQNIWTELASILVEKKYSYGYELYQNKTELFDLLERRLRNEDSERREGFDKDNTTFSGRWDGI